MNARILAIVCGAVVLGVVAEVVLTHRTQTTPIVQPKPAIEHKPAKRPTLKTAVAENQVEQPVPVENGPASNTPTPVVSTAANNPTPAHVPDPTPVSDPRLADPGFKEQVGRYALSFVGADPMADAVWASLIYDPSLSDKVREDLMEDLNENGFSGGNGEIATVDDLPLIETRILLLEAHMDGADDFMLEHLGEAHKDLMNMWTRLNRR